MPFHDNTCTHVVELHSNVQPKQQDLLSERKALSSTCLNFDGQKFRRICWSVCYGIFSFCCCDIFTANTPPPESLHIKDSPPKPRPRAVSASSPASSPKSGRSPNIHKRYFLCALYFTAVLFCVMLGKAVSSQSNATPIMHFVAMTTTILVPVGHHVNDCCCHSNIYLPFNRNC